MNNEENYKCEWTMNKNINVNEQWRKLKVWMNNEENYKCEWTMNKNINVNEQWRKL